MADNALTKLPVLGQIAVSAGAGLAIGAIFYFMVYADMVEQRTQKAGELDALQKTIRELEITVAKLPEFQKEVAALESKLELLKRFLPPEKETADLMKKVNGLAMKATLTVAKFNRRPPVNKDFYQEHPTDVEVSGSYHNLGVFLDQVGRLPRLLNVTDIKIKANTEQRINSTITASFIATTYVYVEKPPTPPGTPGAPRPGAPPAGAPQ
jgi:type IV pilus assembly protein PilO